MSCSHAASCAGSGVVGVRSIEREALLHALHCALRFLLVTACFCGRRCFLKNHSQKQKNTPADTCIPFKGLVVHICKTDNTDIVIMIKTLSVDLICLRVLCLGSNLVF